MTTEAYKPLTEAERVFKSLIWDPFVKGEELALEAAVPALNLPILKQVDEETVSHLSDWLYSQLCLLFDVGAFKFEDSVRQSAYEESSEKLLVLLREKGLDSDEFKKAAADETQTLAKFIHFGS